METMAMQWFLNARKTKNKKSFTKTAVWNFHAAIFILKNFQHFPFFIRYISENKKQRKKWYLFSKNTLCQRIFLEAYYENR